MRIVRPILVNDTNLISSSVPETDYAAYNSGTGYTFKQRVIVTSVHKIYESLRGASSVVTITFASPAVIGWTAHGLPNGAGVKFTTTGTLPTGLVVGTTYFVVNATTNTFNVAATLGGSAINATNAGSGVHTCTDTANLGNDPTTSPSYWLDCGSTNKWRPFDAVVQSQMTATTSLTFTVNIAGLCDTIALLNVTAQTANISISHGADGVVYNQTATLVTDEMPVVDLLTYFFTEFRVTKDVIFDNIPPYANTNITVTLTGVAGSTVGIGAAIFGKAKDISSEKKGVELGAKVGINDYSVKTKDAFGNYTITERAFANRANFTVYVNNEDIDFARQLLTDVRATPTLFIGGRNIGGKTSAASLIIYGYYKSWDIDIAGPYVSICTIEIDGLV